MEVSFRGPTLAKSATAVSVTTSETTMLTISDSKYMTLSQLSLYFDLDLSGGTITSVAFRVYCSPDNAAVASTTWYPIPVRNLSTGELADTKFVIDSTTYAYTANKYRAVLDIPISSCMQIKVTAIGTGTSTATLNTISAVMRDN